MEPSSSQDPRRRGPGSWRERAQYEGMKDPLGVLPPPLSLGLIITQVSLLFSPAAISQDDTAGILLNISRRQENCLFPPRPSPHPLFL
jgi:hypothetical protein